MKQKQRHKRNKTKKSTLQTKWRRWTFPQRGRDTKGAGGKEGIMVVVTSDDKQNIDPPAETFYQSLSLCWRHKPSGIPLPRAT